VPDPGRLSCSSSSRAGCRAGSELSSLSSHKLWVPTTTWVILNLSQMNAPDTSTTVTMYFFCLHLLLALAWAQTPSTAIPNTLVATPASTRMGMSASASSPEYSITALPAVMSQPSCVFNCMIPIGLANPSGCDDVTNDCACLSAPSGAEDVLTSCVQQVCKSSTDGYASTATSLYQSYCQNVYGTPSFSNAFVAEASSAAASSTMNAGTTVQVTVTPTPKSIASSLSVPWKPSLWVLLILASLLLNFPA